MSAWIRSSPLLAFTVLAYAGSWLAWSPWWLARNGVGALPYELLSPAVTGINQLGLFAGPFAAALIVTGVRSGRAGASRLLASLVQLKVRGRWYALVLIAIPLAAGIGYLFVSGFNPEADFGGGFLVVFLIGSYLMFLLGGPLQEEPGWRGVALPLLQHRHHPLTAAMILGLIHCVWHAPLFATAEWDTARAGAGDYLAYLLLLLALSVVMSWVFNGSRGSLLLAILAHNELNWAILSAGGLTGATATTWPAALGLSVLALIAIAATRGRLAYDPADPADPARLVSPTGERAGAQLPADRAASS
ncbi:CPBP family intramembrane glutamic endopeptidase [Brevibacterium luteolum]|uniref:CPBP family intramembrane glutamic endopeptidase n=1 Tax=Brevibacterium luteolum TaxID=199591 RepID=UPI001C24FE2B|nr:CPBP family intramembrane glutamic endopeptidase [Brevibacterium luteolum]MBU8579929.1 CPBP family intramembrane metalloprotease [Brevibacterium luteolum]